MEYLNVKTENKFNWDDIEVGNGDLDHSQNFFAVKHIKHEQLSELQEMELVNKQMASAGLDDTFTNNDLLAENKENVGYSPVAIKMSSSIIENEQLSLQNMKSPLKETIADNNNIELKKEDGKQELDETVKPTKLYNLACQWSTQKPSYQIQAKTMATKAASSKGAISKTAPAPPHAYEFKDVYQLKKEEALQKRLEEERKMREFHSRPMPNYNAHRGKLERQKVVHVVTAAVTPMVLKKSRESREKRLQKLEEWKRNHQQPKFVPRPPTVLNEKPFVPKKTATTVEPRPFNLQSERRLQERKQYNATTQRALVQKHKQVEIEEEERKKREEEQIKEIRKLATFKARPNPFKNT